MCVCGKLGEEKLPALHRGTLSYIEKLSGDTVISRTVPFLGKSTEADALSVEYLCEAAVNVEEALGSAGSSRYGEYPFAAGIFNPAVALEFSLAAAYVKVVSRCSVSSLAADFLLAAEGLSHLKPFKVAVVGVGDEHCEIVLASVCEKYGRGAFKPDGVCALCTHAVNAYNFHFVAGTVKITAPRILTALIDGIVGGEALGVGQM